MRKIKALPIALALAVATGLCPGIAAASQEASEPDLAAAPLSSQAATSDFYALTRFVQKTSGSGSTDTTDTKVAYNANGLAKKETRTQSYGSGSSYKNTVAYAYGKNGALASKAFSGDTTTKHTNRFTTDSAGRITKMENGTLTTTVKYKSGKVASQWTKAKGMSDHYSSHSYTYASGRVSKIKTDESYVYQASTKTFKYDSKGNLKSYTQKWGTDTAYSTKRTYTTTYSNGLPSKVKVKQVTKSNGKVTNSTSWTTSYTYKKIQVPKAMLSKAKAQRWAFLNEDLNFAIGERLML